MTGVILGAVGLVLGIGIFLFVVMNPEYIEDLIESLEQV